MKDIFSSILTLLLLGAIIVVPQAAAVDVAASGDPVLASTGPELTSRFNNATTVEGQSVDLFAEILSQSSSKTNDFWQGGAYALPGDFCFSFRDGVPGEVRSATVRWTFYLSGTNTPISIAGLELTIDDLDDGSSRHEGLETSDALGYTLHSSTDLTANVTNGTLTVESTGGVEQNPGDPKAAVKLHMKMGSSFTITYNTIYGTATSSAYHHDGEGDFAFGNSVYTPIPPALPHIYLTYDLVNDETVPIEVDFYDRLPSDLTWDTAYVPVVSGDMVANVVYSGDEKDATMSDFSVPPGGCTMTLRTKITAQSGSIANDVTITPTDPSIGPITANASVALEGGAPTVVLYESFESTSPGIWSSGFFAWETEEDFSNSDQAQIPGAGSQYAAVYSSGGLTQATVDLSGLLTAYQQAAVAGGGGVWEFSGWLAGWGHDSSVAVLSVEWFDGSAATGVSLGTSLLADGSSAANVAAVVNGNVLENDAANWNQDNWSQYVSSGAIPAGAQSFVMTYAVNPGGDGYADLLSFSISAGSL